MFEKVVSVDPTDSDPRPRKDQENPFSQSRDSEEIRFGKRSRLSEIGSLRSGVLAGPGARSGGSPGCLDMNPGPPS